MYSSCLAPRICLRAFSMHFLSFSHFSSEAKAEEGHLDSMNAAWAFRVQERSTLNTTATRSPEVCFCSCTQEEEEEEADGASSASSELGSQGRLQVTALSRSIEELRPLDTE